MININQINDLFINDLSYMCHVMINNALLIFCYLYTELCVGMIKTMEIDDGIERIASVYSTSEHVLQFSLWPPIVLTSMYIKP